MLKPLPPFFIGVFCRSTFFGAYFLHGFGLVNTEIMVGKTLFCEILPVEAGGEWWSAFAQCDYGVMKWRVNEGQVRPDRKNLKMSEVVAALYERRTAVADRRYRGLARADDPSRLGLAEKKAKIDQAGLQSFCFFPAPFAPRMHACLLFPICIHLSNRRFISPAALIAHRQRESG